MGPQRTLVMLRADIIVPQVDGTTVQLRHEEMVLPASQC